MPEMSECEAGKADECRRRTWVQECVAAGFFRVSPQRRTALSAELLPNSAVVGVVYFFGLGH